MCKTNLAQKWTAVAGIHHSILHPGHYPPWLGITPGVLRALSVLAWKQSTKVNGPLSCDLFLLYPAPALMVGLYADSSDTMARLTKPLALQVFVYCIQPMPWWKGLIKTAPGCPTPQFFLHVFFVTKWFFFVPSQPFCQHHPRPPIPNPFLEIIQNSRQLYNFFY